MPRDAQAMIVTLFVAAHINRNGQPPTEPTVEKFFDLSEMILLKTVEREKKRDELARAIERQAQGAPG